MATLKSASVRFGLITFPVAVQSAVSEDKESKLSMVCAEDHAPNKVKQTTACPTCEKEGNQYSFPRGRDNGDGTFTVVSKEQMEEVNGVVTQDMKDSIALTAHPAAEVDQQTLPGAKMYYLAPGKTAGEPYPMLVDLVKSRPDVAFCTVFAIRSAPAMYRLAVYNDRLALQQLAWPDSVNQAPELRQTTYTEGLLPMAKQFVDTLMMPFDPHTYRDARREVLTQYISDTPAAAAAEASPQAESPLLAALRLATMPGEPAKPVRKKAPAKPRVRKTATVTDIKEKQTA
jgi:non-homologous end joining protein Ku